MLPILTTTALTQQPPSNAIEPKVIVLSDDSALGAADHLVLSNGEELHIRWREITLEQIDVYPPYADDYIRLRELAQDGNAAAGFTLFQILASCKYGYSERGQFEEAIKMLNEGDSLLVPGSKEPVLLTNLQAAEGWKKALPTLFEQCQGITAEQKSNAVEWLDLAAQSGHSVAMTYLSKNIDDYERGVELDQTRWAAGDAGALRDLAIRYYKGYESGEYPENRTKFYAAIYAYSQIALNRYSNDQDRLNGRYEAVEQELESATKELLPRELKVAIAIAEDNLRANRNCCFDF